MSPASVLVIVTAVAKGVKRPLRSLLLATLALMSVSAVLGGLVVGLVRWNTKSVPNPSASAAGQKPAQTQAVGNLTVYDFDQDGRLDAVAGPAGSTLQIIATPQQRDWPALLLPVGGGVAVAVIAGVFGLAVAARKPVEKSATPVTPAAVSAGARRGPRLSA